MVTNPEAETPTRRDSLPRRAWSGGTDGNERLTAATGVVLIVMLAVLGVTIVRIGQLLDVHLFLGLMLLGPVALKLASTGYRFVRYYSGNRAYRVKGPPLLVLRLLAPFVVLSTLAVFATGVALLFVGPAANGTLRLAHKLAFILWITPMAVHVVAHLADLPAALRRERTRELPGVDAGGGRGGRVLALSSALLLGLLAALLLESQFSAWLSAYQHR